MKPSTSLHRLAISAISLLAPAAYAQETKPAAAPVLMPEVVTSATRTERDSFDLPVAIDSVDKSVIREDRLQVNISESLNRDRQIEAVPFGASRARHDLGH